MLQSTSPQRLSCCSKHQTSMLRRSLLFSGLAAVHLQQQLQAKSVCAAEEQQQVLRVGAGQQYTSVAAAVAAAPPGTTVLIDPGRYEEQLLLTAGGVTLAAAQQAGSVTIACSTQQPYRHCLELPASSPDVEVTVRGLRFEHYSKSVANNYAIFAQAGRLTLQQCDILSQSGVGVGVEGATLVLQQCSIHSCERHGVAVFGSLEGAAGRCEVTDCLITGNKLNGVLVKDGAELVARSNSIEDNGGYGVQLSDCSAKVQGNTVRKNKLGSIAVDVSTVTADLQQLEGGNSLADSRLVLL